MENRKDARYIRAGWNWIDSPKRIKLSDENADLASNKMNAKERGAKYPADFDGNGHFRATRVPEDPAPLGPAHGLPLIFIGRGIMPLLLLGRQHVGKFGSLYSNLIRPSRVVSPCSH